MSGDLPPHAALPERSQRAIACNGAWRPWRFWRAWQPTISKLRSGLGAQRIESLPLRHTERQPFLFPAKHLRRERRANREYEDQRRDVANVRRPRLALPDPLEQRYR